MKICAYNKYPENQLAHCAFKGVGIAPPYRLSSNKKDTFECKNSLIKSYEIDNGFDLKEIVFTKPLHVSEALNSIINAGEETLIQDMLDNWLHYDYELIMMRDDLSKVKELGAYKVNKMFAMGVRALVFETENGNILKITRGSHFPKQRKPEDFDLPVKKQGKSNTTFYYVEDKVFQDSITQEELRALVKHIKDKGYRMKDYLVHFDEENADYAIRVCQFGKTADGKLYLIDPGCAFPPPKHFFDVKRLAQEFMIKFRGD